MRIWERAPIHYLIVLLALCDKHNQPSSSYFVLTNVWNGKVINQSNQKTYLLDTASVPNYLWLKWIYVSERQVIRGGASIKHVAIKFKDFTRSSSPPSHSIKNSLICVTGTAYTDACEAPASTPTTLSIRGKIRGEPDAPCLDVQLQVSDTSSGSLLQ